MKKTTMMLVTLLSLSFLPFAANAGHWVVRCHKPCHHCAKVCHKKWVHDGYYHHGHRYHQHHHHHHR